ncbi:MAG: PmoA family protein [Cyclobacteriaceae bacterium]|nr:PmoA family protein [Cyclobacteriaceae bacterium]
MVVASACYSPAFVNAQVKAVSFPDRVDVYIRGNLFTSYHMLPNEKYPYFFPVNGPSKASVTSMRNANFPHHSSLFFGCDKVNGGNYWQEGPERGQIKTVRLDVLNSEGEQVVMENECIWSRPGAMSPIRDLRRIVISEINETMFQIDFEVVMEMLMDVQIERTNHSLFSARMDADLAATNGGTMINAEADRNEAGTFGKASAWIDFYGKRMGKQEGLALMQHPGNTWYPSPWFTRDYGFISPTPMYWPEDPEKGWQLKKGEKVHLHYRVLVHSGDHSEADIAGQFKKYAQEEVFRLK